jgi:RNA polymerase sigma-70 factor (ECF subfamily)
MRVRSGSGRDGRRRRAGCFVALFRHLVLGRPGTASPAGCSGSRATCRSSSASGSAERRPDLLPDLLLERLADPGHTPEERAAFNQRCRRLQSVMRALAPRDRQCIYLRSEGLSYRDIASALGISLGSVSKSLARALGRLASADRR